MAYNFLPADREQLLLMPPSVAEWLPAGHFAWFVVDVVDALDLSAFVAAYRSDGRGGAAYDPAVMLALLVYAYAVGERSSRRIERRLVEDVAFRVVAANQRPDHATIARFRAAHQAAIAALFGQVLAVCGRAGLLAADVVAVDGTKLAANASRQANRTAQQLAEQILREAAAIDADEDRHAAERSGDGEPAEPVLAGRGRARQQRLREILSELETEAAQRSYEAHLERRAQVQAETGRPLRGRRPSPTATTHRSRRQANVTDSDSRLLKTRHGYVQGYNAQAVANQAQVVLAAEVVNDANDAASFAPMLTTAQSNLTIAGHHAPIGQALADAGYWTTENVNLPGIDVLVAPGRARNLPRIGETERERDQILTMVENGELDKDAAAARLNMTRTRVNQLLRKRRIGAPEPLTATMMARLGTPEGKAAYKRRQAIIEPVFGQIKHNRGIRDITRRGLAAADSEWKLICATHNLLKVFRAQPA